MANKKKKAQKRQQIRAKRAAKSKQRAKKKPSFSMLRKAPSSGQAGKWPLMECLVSESWQDTNRIAQVVVARQSAEGHIAVGSFLMDLACLGAKNGMLLLFGSKSEYRREFLKPLQEHQKMTRINLDLAAKIVDEGIKYAKSLGLKPHKDARKAMKMLGDARPEDAPENIPVGGKDGKPLFIAGPYDNTDRIIKILDRNVGPGNYDFILPVSPDSLVDFEEFEDL